MATTGKDVIYIDIDDEITAIIDKLRSSDSKIIALVLPKRATVFQSSVNMKLLKKAAKDTKKRLVLITSEANLLPLAGSIGLYVAKSLQSKPEIPGLPDTTEAEDTIDTLEEPDDTGPDEDFDKAASIAEPVGELAALGEVSKKAKPELTPIPIPRADEAEEAVELDNSVEPVAEMDKKTEKNKTPKDKSLKVPNFNKFRTRLIISALVLILLIVGWIIANIILPKASIIISTETSSLNSNLTLNLSTSATVVDLSSLTLPTHSQQVQKSVSETVDSTGQQNNGTAATGSVTLSAQECSFPAHTPPSIPAGTGLSSSGLVFISQQSTTFPNHGTVDSSGCIDFPANNATPITAQSGGTKYNVSSASFTVNGYQNVTATGSASGGTDNIVQIVSQTDINNATAKLTAPNTSSIKTELQSDLTQAGYFPIPATFSAGTPTTTNSVNAGTQANSVTVTQSTTYTMLGVHQTDLQTVLTSNIDSQINTTKQSILNNGLSGVTFNSVNLTVSPAQVTMQTTATIGPNLSVAMLKTQVAGKKTGQVDSLLDNDPGVTSVKVNLSPFWVSGVPSKTSKITIKFKNSTHASST